MYVFLHQREFILNTRIMELIHTTANFNIKDACQGVRLQQNTVSPGRYHLKINIVILSQWKFVWHFSIYQYFDNSSVRNPSSFYGFIGSYSSVPLVPSILVLNDRNFKANRNENVTRGLKGSWELILRTSETIIAL